MASLALEHYLLLSAGLFSVGLVGVLAKRNVVVILMSIELMLNGVNVALVAFSRYSPRRRACRPHLCHIHHHRRGGGGRNRPGDPPKNLCPPQHSRRRRNKPPQVKQQ